MLQTPSEAPITNWAVYMLNPTALAPLYDDITARSKKHITTASQNLDLSSGHEEHSGSEYFQLIIEGHFLLQAKLVQLFTQLSSGKFCTR